MAERNTPGAQRPTPGRGNRNTWRLMIQKVRGCKPHHDPGPGRCSLAHSGRPPYGLCPLGGFGCSWSRCRRWTTKGALDMPTTKTLISCRLCGEALAALDSWPGKSRTDKLENLIIQATLERPAKEQQLEELEVLIEEARKELADLRHTRQLVSDVNYSLGDILEKVRRIEAKM